MMITAETKKIIYFARQDAKRVGDRCFYTNLIVFLNGDRIELGDNVGFNYGAYVNGYGGLTVGNNCIFGPYCMIHTANHAFDESRVSGGEWIGKPVKIGNNCWIGMGVCVLPGVTVGDRVIIGAGSVVTKDIPADVIAAGNPCVPIKTRSGERVDHP